MANDFGTKHDMDSWGKAVETTKGPLQLPKIS